MSREPATKRPTVLNPVERASESIVGVLMALTITGSVSVATAGDQAVRTMLLAALGSSLASGLTDAVMYLVQTASERAHKIALVRRVLAAKDAAEADRLIADALPPSLAGAAGPHALEAIRGYLLKLPQLHAGLRPEDYVGAAGVALIVVAAMFPVVIPFLLIDDATVALRLSNALGLGTLFVDGWILGRYAYGNPWRSGFAITAIGAVLVAAIIALGG